MGSNNGKNVVLTDESLNFHLQEVLRRTRRFESAAQAVERMILEKGIDKITRAGRTVYDYRFFREGRKHVIGLYDELNEFVNFVQEAAVGASSAEMAFVLVGEPGNGKTFLIDFICSGYRRFLARPENRRYTFEFVNLDQLGKYGNIHVIQSQTFEDPVILAMNFFVSQDEGREYLANLGFDDKELERLYRNYRPLGACTDYILNDIREFCGGDMERILDFIRVVPVRLSENSGMVTGKYSAGDRITSSAVELRGKRSLVRLLNLSDTSNPYRYDLREGALARVAGGGIHHSDEFFRIKPDLVLIYHQVIQSRTIELDGYKWPIDTLIICTSNNDAYNEFVSELKEAPIKDRCKPCFISHNTDYRLQHELARYAIGSEKKATVGGEDIHEDPNLIYALSVAVSLTRLPHSDLLNPIQMMKLEAGEVAGDKNVSVLLEIKRALAKNQDVTKRWGQKGIGHRGLGRIVQRMLAMTETHEGRCLFAGNVFEAFEDEINDYVADSAAREKFLRDLEVAKKLYLEHIKTSVFNAYMNDPNAVRKNVMDYVNMVIGIDSDQLGPDKYWRYRDPQTGQMKPLKIDEKYIESVETRLGLNTKEAKETHRTTIRKYYAQKREENPNYDFMDNEALVAAVTEVRLESDMSGIGSLIGALTNRTSEENIRIYNKMVDAMFGTLKYCRTCAEKTMELYCDSKGRGK